MLTAGETRPTRTTSRESQVRSNLQVPLEDNRQTQTIPNQSETKQSQAQNNSKLNPQNKATSIGETDWKLSVRATNESGSGRDKRPKSTEETKCTDNRTPQQSDFKIINTKNRKSNLGKSKTLNPSKRKENHRSNPWILARQIRSCCNHYKIQQ